MLPYTTFSSRQSALLKNDLGISQFAERLGKALAMGSTTLTSQTDNNRVGP